MFTVTIIEHNALNSFGNQGEEHRVEIGGSEQICNTVLRINNKFVSVLLSYTLGRTKTRT